MTMTQQEYLSILAECVEEVAGVAASEVRPEKSFTEDLGLDSLAMVEVCFATQDSTGVEIPDEALADIKTVQDFLDYVQRR
ncbi:acyl carrier protein [Nonomuraea sp. NPDC003707]